MNLTIINVLPLLHYHLYFKVNHISGNLLLLNIFSIYLKNKLLNNHNTFANDCKILCKCNSLKLLTHSPYSGISHYPLNFLSFFLFFFFEVDLFESGSKPCLHISFHQGGDIFEEEGENNHRNSSKQLKQRECANINIHSFIHSFIFLCVSHCGRYKDKFSLVDSLTCSHIKMNKVKNVSPKLM